MEHQIFSRADQLPILVCKQCRTGVRPEQASGHLNHAHLQSLSAEARQAIAEAVSHWEGLETSTDYTPPKCIASPILEIPVWRDGLVCTADVDADPCGYICRTLLSMKKHLKAQHRDLLQSKAYTIDHVLTNVLCQQVFKSGPGSHLIQIQNPQPDPDAADPVTPSPLEAEWDHLASLDAGTLEAPIIRRAQRDEANPFLVRTGWLKQLEGCDPDDLQRAVEKPSLEDPRESEAIARALWDAMGCVARSSQTVASLLGHSARIAIVRVERDRLPHKPLQAYMDHESIQKHCAPWQQILVFFARTQVPHTWRSPRYILRGRRHRAWQHLWQLAELSVREQDRDQPMADDQPDDQPQKEETDKTWMVEDLEENFGYSEAIEEDLEYNIDPYADVHDPVQLTLENLDPLTKLQIACLDFCIELLNQRINFNEYECPLLTALAVQGLGPGGWRTCDSFPPILSKVIKVARFMVLHKALLLAPDAVYSMQQTYNPLPPARPPKELEFPNGQKESPMNEEAFLTSGSLPFAETRQQLSPKSFNQWLVDMVDSFMVRGSMSPFAWILDLRTYALHVHFRSTLSGYIGWMGTDKLLYKELTFTMGQFRGFVHGMVRSTREFLCQKLLFGQEIPAIPWDGLYDDPTASAVGWSFLKDPRTQWPVNGSQWLFHLIRTHPAIRQRFIDSSGQHLSRNAISIYLKEVVKLRELFSTAIHICGGQPARGNELLSIRHRNTPSGGLRDLFIEDGLVTMVTKYHKGFYASNDTKVIHRYLPRELGELVVWYLWLVLPFVEQLQAFLIQSGHKDHVRYETLLSLSLSRLTFLVNGSPSSGHRIQTASPGIGSDSRTS